ncbi:Nif3-like dinuclear metal center hexameric protein [Geobacter pelophilus]|uniref:GTP cyclohydrolase 1 type 2 homolog n=1 Tax=Geoanaerobacter pelophilus TaxID=60036 RepID=A0AAW4KYU5_9BACT|nr:Nif3-like dinuclear metal center hexameric protein [Geoanaerobacter pelophilus]MBT0663813.1 Nif3-like dinuclear metal center hexameric protein [Geoanaerobacter pelophilus]
MNTPRVSDVVGIINKIAPLRFAEGWDNPGLQVGNNAAPVERIMIALDASEGSVEAAIAHNCTLLLTHHPLLFKPLKRVSREDADGAIVFRAIEGGLAIVALHTNYDIATGGVNDLLAERLGLEQTVPLQVTARDELVKLGVFVPVGHEDRVLQVLSPFSEQLGNYSDCTFRIAGTGTFRPLAGARPFLGKEGELASVEESRIELMLRSDQVNAAVSALKRVHPYEEPAFDLFKLSNCGKSFGLGRIGELPEQVALYDFAQQVKERLETPALRFVGDGKRKIKRVAICGGSGVSLLNAARFKGADVLVTGDVKYHEARDAEAHGIALVDAGHFATERIMVSGLAERLGQELSILGFKAELVTYNGEKEPFSYV